MNVNNFNDAIERQALTLEADMKSRGVAAGINHRSDSPSNSDSLRKLKVGFRRTGGMTNRIGYKFPRQLIYPHTGSGKGQGGLLGSRWQNKFGQTVKTNPRSLGKANTGNRKAKPFIDAALSGPQGIPKLGEIAATELGAVITGNLFIDKNNIGK